jgi:hypothetical protein
MTAIPSKGKAGFLEASQSGARPKAKKCNVCSVTHPKDLTPCPPWKQGCTLFTSKQKWDGSEWACSIVVKSGRCRSACRYADNLKKEWKEKEREYKQLLAQCRR